MNTRRALLLLHLLGVAAFFGSLLVHALGGWLTGDTGPASTLPVLLERVAWTVTVPGLWIAVMAGSTLALSGFASFGDRWIQLKVAAALAMIVITHVVLLPALVEAARTAASGTAAVSGDYADPLRTVGIAAVADLGLAAMAAVAGVWKFGRRRRR